MRLPYYALPLLQLKCSNIWPCAVVVVVVVVFVAVGRHLVQLFEKQQPCHRQTQNAKRAISVQTESSDKHRDDDDNDEEND